MTPQGKLIMALIEKHYYSSDIHTYKRAIFSPQCDLKMKEHGGHTVFSKPTQS
jgi:hypothetical protein